ncbi:MAG: Glutamyl-tRNA reductase, partial [Chlamydiia bacterium]|nr:Glutamyl-tRNA reductase [Chlamydiia bacterium]
SKATLLSEELGGDVVDWSDLLEHWSDFDFVISGVTSPTAILKSKSPYLPKDKLLIDLAVPRNIAPDIGCTLLNIDDLNTLLEKRKVALQTSIKDSEAVIEQLIEKQIIRFKEKTTLYKLLSA